MRGIKTIVAPPLFFVVLFIAAFSCRASTYGPTKAGDDLWDIARQAHPGADITRDQAMLAILQANPDAFSVPCNADSYLKAGVMLQIPSHTEMQALSKPELSQQASAEVERQAEKGFRTLGVARTAEDGSWRFLGMLPLFDPPREDSRATIESLREMGVDVKMVTGDHTAIARQVSEQLFLGTHITSASRVFGDAAPANLAEMVEHADGFAEVFPEHKYEIVNTLQGTGRHIVGMTGDGVNDAPALKKADIGVAVSGATDAARAAADLVLTAPGLSVIARAAEEARRIFGRMVSYATYRISATVSLLLKLLDRGAHSMIPQSRAVARVTASLG